MIQGFNSHIGYMTGHYWCPSGALEGDKYTQVTAQLTDSVLRFPGGTISRSYNYWSEDINYFNKLCSDTGSKTTFVVNMSDIQNSINTAKSLTAEIVLFECGNEEYDYPRPPRGWEWLLAVFNPRAWYRKLGQEYGRKYLEARSKIFAEFGDVPVAACVNIPNDNKNIGWLDGVKDIAGVVLNDLVIHRYRNPGEKNFLENLRKHLPKLDDYNLYYTELNCKWRPGEFQYLAYGDEHRRLLWGYINNLKVRPNTKMILVHSLWGHHLFSRYVPDGGIVIDKYKDWY